MATTEKTVKQRADSIEKFLISKKDGFAALMPKHLTPERMVKGFMAAAIKSPNLLKCTNISILNTVLVAVSLGLDIGRPRGGLYAIPFWSSKVKQYECVGVPDYRGLIDIALRSDKVMAIEAREVYEGDEFDYAYGLTPYCNHKPVAKGRGALTHVYAVAAIRDGPPSFEVMTVEDVDLHRARSKAKDSGPWITDYPAMALKTVIKRLCNLLPQAQENLQLAMEVDSRRDHGEGISDLFDVIEIEGDTVIGETEVDQAKDRLAKKAGGPEPVAKTGPEPVADPGPEPVAKTGTEPQGDPAPYGKGNAMPTSDATPPPEAKETQTDETPAKPPAEQPPADSTLVPGEEKPGAKKKPGRPKKNKTPEPQPAEQQGDPGPDEPAAPRPHDGDHPAQPHPPATQAPETPPQAAAENGPEERDPEVQPLHSMHDSFIKEGGGYAAAVTTFNKAWEDLSEDNPRALAMMYAEKGATWSQFADSEDEVIALSTLKKHYFQLAAIEGFDQS